MYSDSWMDWNEDDVLSRSCCNFFLSHCQLRARRVLSIFKDIPLRTRRALSLYKVCGESALLVLTGTSLNSDNALLALNWWTGDGKYVMQLIMLWLRLQIKSSRKSHIRQFLQNWVGHGPGGGGVLTPNFGRYVPQQSEKWARAPERAPGRAWKCGAPERAWAVLSLKMCGLWNELDPFWAWKCESLELPGCVWLTLWPAANPRRCWTLRAEPPWEGDEWVEIKEILKMMVSGTSKSTKKCKMVMLQNGCFGNLWKWYAPERKFRAENGGLVCIHMEVPPPPPPGHGYLVVAPGSTRQISMYLVCCSLWQLRGKLFNFLTLLAIPSSKCNYTHSEWRPKNIYSPSGNKPLLYHKIGNRNLFIVITNQ